MALLACSQYDSALECCGALPTPSWPTVYLDPLISVRTSFDPFHPNGGSGGGRSGGGGGGGGCGT